MNVLAPGLPMLGSALKGRRDRVLLSVKFGALRTPDGGWGGVDGRPAAVKNFLAYSLQRLKTDHVDIYRLAGLDPQVPIEDTIGAVADLVRAGYVRYIGLSEVSAETVALSACNLQLSDDAIARIAVAVPPDSVSGARYAAGAAVPPRSDPGPRSRWRTGGRFQ